MLYFDFELTDKQFESRYSANLVGHHNFDQHFMRIEINPDLDLPDGLSFEDHFLSLFEAHHYYPKCQGTDLDNLTY